MFAHVISPEPDFTPSDKDLSNIVILYIPTDMQELIKLKQD